MEVLLVLLGRARKPVFLMKTQWVWQPHFAHSRQKASFGQKPTGRDKPKGLLGFFRFIVASRRDTTARFTCPTG
jgi:hypothetical protein